MYSDALFQTLDCRDFQDNSMDMWRKNQLHAFILIQLVAVHSIAQKRKKRISFNLNPNILTFRRTISPGNPRASFGGCSLFRNASSLGSLAVAKAHHYEIYDFDVGTQMCEME